MLIKNGLKLGGLQVAHTVKEIPEGENVIKSAAKFVSERTEFLRRYALEHDVPFVIFSY